MRYTDRFIRFFSNKLQGKYDLVIVNKIVIISLINLMSFLVSIALVVFQLVFYPENIDYLIFIGIAAVLLFNYMYVLKTKKYSFAAYLILMILATSIFYYLFNAVNPASILAWMLVFPFLAIILLPLLSGFYISIIFYAITLAAMVIGKVYFKVAFGIDAMVNFILAYPVLSVLFYIYLYIKETVGSYTEKTLLDTQKAYKEKDDFLSKLSYNIRQPLYNILGIISLLNKTELSDKQQDFIDTIQASASNLAQAVSNINEVPQFKIGLGKNTPISFNLNLTINSTIELFTSQAMGSVKFNYNPDNSVPSRIIGNPILIKQLFLNLIENLIKNKSGRTLTIDILTGIESQNDDKVVIGFEIKSDKPIKQIQNKINLGLSPSDLQNHESAAYKDIYNELDLNVTSNIIETAGGKLKVNVSLLNLSFYFSLEFEKNIKSVEKERVEQLETILPIDYANSKKTVELEKASVLLVEDNAINQKIMLLSLNKLVKSIEVANNGKEALDKFATTRYDIILMDVQMPIMDGIKATKKIRELEQGSGNHVPIIAITANALSGDREVCLNAGMDEYVSKPFQMKDLLDKIGRLLKY